MKMKMKSSNKKVLSGCTRRERSLVRTISGRSIAMNLATSFDVLTFDK